MITSYWVFKPAQRGQIHYFICSLFLLPIGIFIILFRVWFFKKMFFNINNTKIDKYNPVYNYHYVFDLVDLVEIKEHKLSFFKLIRYYNLYLIFKDESYLKLRLPYNEHTKEEILTYISSFLERNSIY